MSSTDQGAGGYGQMGPNDTSSLFNMISFICRQIMNQLQTMMPVQVKAVHGGAGVIAAAGTVDVLPLVSQIDSQGNSVPYGTVYGVPWFRLQSGTTALILDPQVGDIGMLVCASRDISSVVAAGKASTPGSRRKYDLADGIYVGGILNGAPDQYVAFTSGGITFADKNGNVLKMDSNGFELTGNLTVTGTITATGEITKGSGPTRVTLGAHIHSGNNVPPTPGN